MPCARRSSISSAPGRKGTDIRKNFGNPPYGWPQDAIDAALMVLHASGQVQARSGRRDDRQGQARPEEHRHDGVPR